MADDKTTLSRPVEPVQVAVIGTGDVKRLPSGTEAVTPGPNQPNLVTNVVQPAVAILVRFVNLFGVQFVGLIVAGMTPAGGKLLYTSDFLHMLVVCANLSLPGALLGMFKDIVTVFGRLEHKYPLATGSV